MLLLRTDRLPEGPNQGDELKLDGYRALAIKTGGRVKLRSRNDNDFNGRYPAIVNALSAMPDETVIDGEVVALDELGRPSFNLLQNYGSAGAQLIYYVFDVLVLNRRNLMSEPLVEAHLLPRAGSLAGFVSTLQAFRHQPFKPLGAHGRDQVSKTCIEHRRLADRLAELGEDLIAKDLPPANQRLRH